MLPSISLSTGNMENARAFVKPSYQPVPGDVPPAPILLGISQRTLIVKFSSYICANWDISRFVEGHLHESFPKMGPLQGTNTNVQ